MFLEFYKLREQPFGVTPDPRFLYFGAAHREALASLLYSIETKRGFTALIAEPGMGKTSLLFRMLESLQGSARTAFLFQTEGNSHEILGSLLRDLGIQIPGPDPGAMHQALNESLLQDLQAGKQVVAVIDEAQNLDARVLETIRLLSNFETSKQKLMHIVLAGQPGLAEKLSDDSMTQLRQRIASLIRLAPFGEDDVCKYIQHRLRAAGYEGPTIFTPDAVEMVARASKGIPRNINSLCFQSLSIGFATQSKRIGAEIVREVVSDLDFSPQYEDPRREREPIQWRLPTPEPARSSEETQGRVWGRPQHTASRPSRGKWVAAIACLAAVTATIVALSGSKLEVTRALPGRVSEQIVNAVSNSPNPDAVVWPDKLKAPDPESPKATEAPTSAITAEVAKDTPGETAAQETAQSESTDRSSAKVPTGEKTKPVNDNRVDTLRHRDGLYGEPTSVQVLRSETIFQFAQEIYGKSTWTIIEAICAANPAIHDPYSILSVGQWIRLPSDLETAAVNYNLRGPIGRSR